MGRAIQGIVEKYSWNDPMVLSEEIKIISTLFSEQVV